MSYKEYLVRVYDYGAKVWNLNGRPHREDGPAVENDMGKSWWFNGQLHREDGPAVENADGRRAWYLDGKQLTEAQFLARKNSYVGKVVEIDGKKYTLQSV